MYFVLDSACHKPCAPSVCAASPRSDGVKVTPRRRGLPSSERLRSGPRAHPAVQSLCVQRERFPVAASGVRM